MPYSKSADFKHSEMSSCATVMNKLITLVTWLVASLHSLHYDDDWKERSEYILHSNVQLKIILNCPQPNGLLLNTHSQKLVLDAAIEQHRNMPSWFKITDAPATGAICQLVFKAGAEMLTTGVSVPYFKSLRCQ